MRKAELTFSNCKQLLQLPEPYFSLAASCYWIWAVQVFLLCLPVLFSHPHLLSSPSVVAPLSACSTSHSRPQQDSSEGKEGVPLVFLWAAWKGRAGHVETQPRAGRLRGSGLLCQAKWPHDRAPIPGESLAEPLVVWQSAHHPACRCPGWRLLHLCLPHICWRAKKLHSLPLHLW